MNLVLVLSLSIIYIEVAISEPDVINIGGIFTFGSINGKVAKIGMQAAVHDVNSDPTILGGRKLALTLHDSNYSEFMDIIGALQYMETDTVAIIGPQSSVMAHVLSHLSNELHVPLLSFTALDPTLSPLQFPYFVQTAPNDMFQMSAISDIISYFGWKEVTVIFSDDDKGRNGVNALGDQLAETRSKISYKAVLPPDPKVTKNEIRDALIKVRLRESRVIILHTFSKTGLLVFDVARFLGMMESGYVWIATTWLSTVLDSTSPLPYKTAKSIQGAITLRPHTPDSDKKRAFFSRWDRLSNGTIGVNPYGLYAYDTVWIIAYALKSLLNQGVNISFSDDLNLIDFIENLSGLSIFDGGKQLLENILNTNMTGLTGLIRFDPERSLKNPAYDLINVIRTGFRDIGYWSNYSGLSVEVPETLYASPRKHRHSSNQNLHNIVWPGGTMEKPRGWVFPENGRQLRIGIPRRVTYQEFVSLTDNRGGGYCIDVFIAALNQLPYPVPYYFIFFGDGHKNPSYDDLVSRITSGEFDAVVGDIAILTNRTKSVDFTQPYIESGLVVVTPIQKTNSDGWGFLRPFTPLMWVIIAASFLIVGAVVWILEHRINDEFRGPPKHQFVTILWFSFSTMFFSHKENTVSTLGRMVLIIWLFVVLIINSSYTASLTSILTVQQLTSPITGIESLITGTEPIGYQVGSFAENYLYEELNIPKSRLVALNSSQEYALALETRTVSAIVDELPYINLFLSAHCKFSIRGQAFTKSGWGFGFQRDSPLAIDMSTAILTLSENGDLQKIHDKWLARKACSNTQISESDQLELQSFRGLFLISGISCFIALLTYFCLVLRKFSQHLPEQPVSLHGSSRSVRLQTFLSFVDDKERESHSKSKRKRTNLDESIQNGASRIQINV